LIIKGVENIHRTSKLLAILLAFILLCSVASAATLKVGPKEKYHTIQSAVNAAHDRDTIKVAYGTYKENVKVNKNGISILGTKYPKVNGFRYYECSDTTINGFSIQKDGIGDDYGGGYHTIRNNYFYNCGISLWGPISSMCSIINNQFSGSNSGISTYDCEETIIQGNTINGVKIGLWIDEDAGGVGKVTKNTFKNCKTAVYIHIFGNPGKLENFVNNKYINNKVNFAWGSN
jgi:parallel beta-helix repeat protein